MELAPTEAQGYPQVRLEPPRNSYVVTRTNIGHSSPRQVGWRRRVESNEGALLTVGAVEWRATKAHRSRSAPSSGEQRKRIAHGWCRRGEQRRCTFFCLSLFSFLLSSRLFCSIRVLAPVVRKEVPMAAGQDFYYMFQPERQVLARPGL